jgi:hypothetical protein
MKTTIHSRALLVSLCMLTTAVRIHTATAYITSKAAVPVSRQMEWLKEITVDICESQPGCLSDRQLSQVPEVMKAWSHSKRSDRECALAVESLVKRVIDERIAGNDHVSDFTADDYNCLVEGWARSGGGEAAAERCEQIITAMQEQGGMVAPNLTTFKAVLMAWSQATQAEKLSYGPHRAQRVLEWMIQLYSTGENPRALPDADCFDICLQTWSGSGHADAPAQTEQVLGVMERLYESTQLVKLKPRTTSFNAVLAAWSKSGRPEAADRASNILAFMEILSKQGDVAPDYVSYSIVMGVLAKSQDQVAAARKAGAFLRHAEISYQESVHAVDAVDDDFDAAAVASNGLVPDTILFNTAMGCWAKSIVLGSYLKARSILNRQTALYESGCEKCRPDVYGFTSVIAACASEHGSKKERLAAFQVALDTYRELEQYPEDSANHVTYGTMLKACGKLLPSGSPVRRKWVRRVFQDAAKTGCVGDMVLGRMREAASPDIFKELMQGIDKRRLPQSWTCNVDQASDRRRKNGSRQYTNNRSRKRAEV